MDKKSRLAFTSLGIAGLAALLLSLLFWTGALGSLESRFEDKLFLEGEIRSDILIVAIDDQSLQAIGRWPWDRSVVAGLVERIATGRPRVLGIDINFSEPTNQDQVLAAALVQDFPVVLPVEGVLEIPEAGARQAITVTKLLAPVSEIASSAELGLTNTPPDSDGIVRRLPVKVVDADGNFIKSFGARIAELASAERGVVRIDEHNQAIVNFSGGPGLFASVSAGEVLKKEFDSKIFENKIVLIGATAPDLHDTWLTPTAKSEPMPGIEVHASFIQTIIDKNFLAAASPFLTVVIIFALALLLALSSIFARLRWHILLTLAGGIFYIVAAVICFDLGTILNIIYPFAALIAVFTTLSIYRYLHEEREKREVRRAFGYYLSPHVIEEVLKDPKKLSLGGEKKELTVLFSDIRGFTALSEGLSPEELTRLMNKYLSEMTRLVLSSDGVLDKYIGDALMAFWGAPLPEPRHAERACRTALLMIKKLDDLNRSAAWPGGREIAIGIGINTGGMVVGNMGSAERFDYTVLGDAVNLGSRSEGLNKEYGTRIIITEFTKAALSEGFFTREIDRVAVKGKKEGVKIFELVGFTGDLPAAQKQSAAEYEKALGLYRNKKWDEAIGLLGALDDPASKNLAARCGQFKKFPPPDDWDGTWIMETK